MKAWKWIRWMTVLQGIFLLCSSLAYAGPLIAYSLAEAEQRLKDGQSSAELIELGRMTRIRGMVYEQDTGDLLIIGERDPNGDVMTLDDLVVALRAILVHKKWPLVSIDRVPDTEKTGLQEVRFEGGIANTHLGKTLLEADVILKKLALGKLSGKVWGVTSYYDLSVDTAKHNDKTPDVGNRFWFATTSGNVIVREGIFVIQELPVQVEVEVMNGGKCQSPKNNRCTTLDTEAQAFAKSVTASYEDLQLYYPALRQLKTLFHMVALAHGADMMKAGEDMEYWLNQYSFESVETPKHYELLSRKEKIDIDAQSRTMTIDGGIELKALSLKIADGDPTALRDAVLKSRPSANALFWRIPLSDWRMMGDPDKVAQAMEHDPSDETLPGKEIGMWLERRFDAPAGMMPAFQGPRSHSFSQTPNVAVSHPQTSFTLPKVNAMVVSPPPPMPKFDYSQKLPGTYHSHRVGGVMLHGSAKASGGKHAKVDLANGNFSFVMEGKNAELAPEALRKFMTALWAIYYSDQDPGISIDPIAPGVDKHLVRYIGRVINFDLGRVMREADYLMKKWAVGAEIPSIPGFQDVDTLMARYGRGVMGASRRFWFVPQNMQFTRSGNLLLFNKGEMTLQTEYVLQNRVTGAAPSDVEFAKFFTHNYEIIAKQYPVYRELFEYAKMVSLAKYLKEKGVPLYWFLMANKDRVLTEDAIGTVDELAKGSEHFRGMEIRGGVDLGFQGKYVFDETAMKAFSQARARTQPSSKTSRTGGKANPDRKAQPTPVSFKTETGTYTVVPQHSLTAGKDRRGIRYQTDFALRKDGKPSLEVVRYLNPSRPTQGAFGNGWELLIPYRVEPADEETREFLTAIIPQRMAVINMMTGEREILSFSTDRYTIAGYVPDKLEDSQLVGLFLMSNASYRLADKLGNQFHFDPSGDLTDMFLSRKHHMKITYEWFNGKSKSPMGDSYGITVEGSNFEPFLNAEVPQKIRVGWKNVNREKGELFEFQAETDFGFSGYVPVNSDHTGYEGVALMTDGSFVLFDKQSRETLFGPDGSFRSVKAKVVKSIAQDGYKVVFDYEAAPSQPRIKRAHVTKQGKPQPEHEVQYVYDRQGRLDRITNSG